MPADKIDLSGSLQGQVSVKPEEHPDERTARLRAEQRGALIEDCKASRSSSSCWPASSQ